MGQERIAVDTAGNELFITDTGSLVLKLRERGESRYIGYMLTLRDDTTVYKKILKPEHIYRAFDAFGFNENVLNHLKPDLIVVHYTGGEGHDEGQYVITAEKFNEKKQYMNFKKEGFELQCFVPVSEFRYNKRKDYSHD